MPSSGLLESHVNSSDQAFFDIAGIHDERYPTAFVFSKSAEGIDWYEAFACLKMEALAIRMMDLRDMPENVRTSEAGRRTAKMLDRI